MVCEQKHGQHCTSVALPSDPELVLLLLGEHGVKLSEKGVEVAGDAAFGVLAVAIVAGVAKPGTDWVVDEEHAILFVPSIRFRQQHNKGRMFSLFVQLERDDRAHQGEESQGYS